MLERHLVTVLLAGTAVAPFILSFRVGMGLFGSIPVGGRIVR